MGIRLFSVYRDMSHMASCTISAIGQWLFCRVATAAFLLVGAPRAYTGTDISYLHVVAGFVHMIPVYE